MKENLVCEKNRLKFFPVSMFAIVMGIGGFTIMYQKSALWLGFSHVVGVVLTGIVTILFFLIATVYILKFFRYFSEIKKEFAHPIRINFFAAISISMLMLAIIYKEYNITVSAFFWYPGAFLHFYLTMHTISFWINKNQELGHLNPAWFIPVVGNILAPVGGIGFANEGILIYFFSIGLFFWIVLFAILLNRIIFHKQLAVKFMPTLFIFIAPPAVGFLAYFKLYETIDMFAMILFNLALFFTLFIAFIYKNFIKIKFFISWWAFIFPLAAMTMASMLMYNQTGDSMLLALSYTMIAVTTTTVFVVAYQTILHIKKGEICTEE